MAAAALCPGLGGLVAPTADVALGASLGGCTVGAAQPSRAHVGQDLLHIVLECLGGWGDWVQLLGESKDSGKQRVGFPRVLH